MASDTRNVKLGVCQVFYAGQDLGYTIGGVEVAVSTESHEVNIDQFGKTAVNQILMGRDIKVKVPLAETTIENMVRIMPGATLVATGATKATGTWTPGSNPTAGQTLILNGSTVTFRVSAADATKNEVNLGASVAATLTSLAAFLNAATDGGLAAATYTVSATVLTITAATTIAADGNAYTLAVGTAAGAVSGAYLTGGVDATKKRVDVATGIGIDLLAIAKELRLHPSNKVASDKTEDFVIPRAATPGALTFAYKLDSERVYNVEFMGYPDANGKIFSLGDPTAT